jgi:hypothetical protein
MAGLSLEERVAALEADVAQLKTRLAVNERRKGSWIEQIWGTFANDPIYDEAMRLGRKWREYNHPHESGKLHATASRRSRRPDDVRDFRKVPGLKVEDWTT